MSRIKIKNFGPIREGFVDNDGWMDIEKVTVFIGDQGSGKSTVAKLISLFSWIEKSIARNTISPIQLNVEIFKNLCLQQEIFEYFSDDTYLSFEGDAYDFEYDERKKSFKAKVNGSGNENYILPKIQYVSAARNLLTILYNISLQQIPDKNGNIIDLSSNIPFMVKVLNFEYMKALEAFAQNGFSLPVNDTSVYFQNHNTFIIAKGKRVAMASASSGIQSITPLLLVSHFLLNEVSKNIYEKVKTIDNNLKSRIEANFSEESAELLEKFKQVCVFGKGILTEKKDEILLDEKLKKFIPSFFINIVEEPEQNLFPTSQQKVINSLLEYNNAVKENKLIITTHSPYIINYLMLAIKASEIERKAKVNKDVKSKIYEIVPENAITHLKSVTIYELNEVDGTITKLKQSSGLPSNEHYLNNLLGETNILFSKLMEIEDLCEE